MLSTYFVHKLQLPGLCALTKKVKQPWNALIVELRKLSQVKKTRSGQNTSSTLQPPASLYPFTRPEDWRTTDGSEEVAALRVSLSFLLTIPKSKQE